MIWLYKLKRKTNVRTYERTNEQKSENYIPPTYENYIPPHTSYVGGIKSTLFGAMCIYSLNKDFEGPDQDMV